MKQTHLMYRVNINFSVLSEIAADLTEKGLLVEKVIRKRSFFKTTTKGYDLLKEWRQLKATVGA